MTVELPGPNEASKQANAEQLKTVSITSAPDNKYGNKNNLKSPTRKDWFNVIENVSLKPYTNLDTKKIESDIKLQEALSKLPFLATIKEIKTNAYYGYLLREDISLKIHFRIDNLLTEQSHHNILTEGDKVFCQIGSTISNPNRCAVLWAPLLDFDWEKYSLPNNQESLDLIRSRLLQELNPSQLDNVVDARWYKDKWNGTPPQDLSDPILEKTWLKRLALLSPDAIESLDLPLQLSNNPFVFTKKNLKPKVQPDISHFLKLPFLATIKDIRDNGFGFLEREGNSEKEFFHVSKSLTEKSNLSELKYGDKLLCQIGSTSREPNKSSAVLWAPLLDFDWSEYNLPDNQESLDLIRRKVLHKLPLKKLNNIMAAKWYSKQWNNIPPQDLSDPILEETWIKKIAELSPSVFKSHILPTKLLNSLFTFTKKIDTNSKDFSVSLLLSTFSPAHLAKICAPQKEWLASSWLERSENINGSVNTPRKLKDAEKVRILEWFFEYHSDISDESVLTVLKGTRKYEATLARRLLARSIPLSGQLYPWIRNLITKGWLQADEFDSLVDIDPALAISIFTSLTLSTQHTLRKSWENNNGHLKKALVINPKLSNDIIPRVTIAIDLDTDKENIMEIGIAHHDNNTRLYDAAQNTDLEKALKNLSVQVSEADIVAGYNTLAWDLPILSDRIPNLSGSLIWDTLLVQFLLKPQTLPHALGSNHHTEIDAKNIFNMFLNQIDSLNQTLKTEILLGKFKTSQTLIDAIILALPENLTYIRPLPTFLNEAKPDTAIFIRPMEIYEINWVPKVQVVSINSNEYLDTAYQQIDIKHLHDMLDDQQRRSPNVLILLAVCTHAKQQNISVRRNMIPNWLCDGLPWLVDAIDQSCTVPDDTGMIRVAALSVSNNWWADTVTSNQPTFHIPDWYFNEQQDQWIEWLTGRSENERTIFFQRNIQNLSTGFILVSIFNGLTKDIKLWISRISKSCFDKQQKQWIQWLTKQTESNRAFFYQEKIHELSLNFILTCVFDELIDDIKLWSNHVPKSCFDKRHDEWIQWLTGQTENDRTIFFQENIRNLSLNFIVKCISNGLMNDRTPLIKAMSINPTSSNDIILRLAMAIDLETDGESIREIGVAHHDNNTCLHDTTQGTDIKKALKNLSRQINETEIVIGHKILSWDWPILSNMIPDLPNSLIWDTLLVQFLLEPQAQSHALGSNHRAEIDAKTTYGLFVNQLQILDTTIKTKILSGQVKTCEALIDAIILALPKNLTYARSVPKFLIGEKPNTPTLIHSEDIRQVDWVSGVQIVPVNADESLDLTYWQIDIENLQNVLSDDQRRTPNAMVLLAMCIQAKQQNIAVRRNMIPNWICSGLSWLVDAIDQSCFVPTNTEAIHISPFPKSLHWWANAATMRYRAVLPNKSPLIINRYTLSNEDVVQLDTTIKSAIVGIPKYNGTQWILQDFAAGVLDIKGGWRGFDVTPIPEIFEIVEHQSNAQDIRPQLAVREFPTLFPGSRTQGDYWISQIAAIRAIRKNDTVSIFLLTSTTSRTMIERLNTACAEIGIAEIKPVHRSRREHLKRTLNQSGIIVDGINQWHNWQSIAYDVGITLQPIVEALPLEEWHAISLTDNQVRDNVEEQVSFRIPMVEVLKDIQKLVESQLDSWLVENNLAKSTLPPIILDPRLETEAYNLHAQIDRKPITLQDWSVNHYQRLRNVFADFDIKPEKAPSDLAAMEQFLIKNWQPHDQSGGNIMEGFKQTQIKAIEHICTRTKDIMVTLPTGEGKSVLFQVPALCRGLRNRRLTLVISPLKALMRDQVTRLHEQKFCESADFINSDQSPIEQAEILQGVLDHRIILLYIAPERLRNANFVDVLQRRIESDGGLEYVVFDEAHCINHWGYEFRPDYFFAFNSLMNILRDGKLPNHTPFLMLSATLTRSDQNSIKEILERTAQEEAILPFVIYPDPTGPTSQDSPLQSHIRVSPQAMKDNIFKEDSFRNALEERLPYVIEVINKAHNNTETTDQRSAVINFVSRRNHADELANELTHKTRYNVESYHAGLDASTREDIYDQFRSHDLDFLVATKAFGMGMDIPDIHWVVHLAPPKYLEDYLQEVGRIGRGFVERQNAKLDKLDAILLASPADFENIRSQQKDSEIQEPQINAIEKKILENSEIINDRRVTIVPDDGYEIYKSPSQKRTDATQLRMALYWLETAGHLKQLGMVADILKIRIVPTRLAEIAEVADMDTNQGRVAHAILTATNEEMKSKTLDSNLLRHISKSVSVHIKDTDRDGTDIMHDVLINLSRLQHQCHIDSLDKTMSIIVELASQGALKLKWELEFAKRPLLDENSTRINIMITKVGEEVHKLFNEMKKTGKLEFIPSQWFNFDPQDLFISDEIKALTKPEQARHNAKLERFRRYFTDGFRTLSRACGVKFKQVVQSETNAVQLIASLETVNNEIAKNQCDQWLAQAQSLLAIFKSKIDVKAINVETLIQQMELSHPGKTFYVSDLKSLLYLLSSLRLVSAMPDLLPISYVLQLQDTQPGLGQHPELVKKLKSVNEMANLRIFAMEIFTNLTKKARDDFIPGYFTKANESELRQFLDVQLDEAENESDEQSNREHLASLHNQLRATRIEEFFARYQSSQEPNQWKAMQHPFDQHLLVNAGPGAGKTSVLIGRIIHLIHNQNIKPSEIIVLAFNRAVVFEIRKNIREIFRDLGYASYSSRVRVSTFHSFAVRKLYNSDTPPKNTFAHSNDRDSNNGLLKEFSHKLKSDATFRQDVVEKCSSILIDEFQDMNEDIYSIIRSLHKGSNTQTGVMVIGDDDQDILRWNRTSPGIGCKSFAELYFQRFKENFGNDKLTIMELGVNFRSGNEIVQKSQQFIKKFFNINNCSQRLKTNLLQAKKNAQASKCEHIISRNWTWNETLEHVVKTSQKLLAENPGSIAILCRDNAEVANVHHMLIKVIPNLVVQSNDNIMISSLRHIALWIEFLEIEIVQQDQVLSDSLFADLFKTFYTDTNIPEIQNGTAKTDFREIWELCIRENVNPHLSTLNRFMKILKSDELQRMRGTNESTSESVVSTINKVKGLEYDNVIIIPSRHQFPFSNKSHDIKADAAEEARLFYVAMTRAKSRLVYYIGNREYSWGQSPPRPIKGEYGQDKILTGVPDQVTISWSMDITEYHRNPEVIQNYIKTKVAVGDKLELGGYGGGSGKVIFHRTQSGKKRQVGFLAKECGAGGAHSKLKVSAVIRYDLDKEYCKQPAPCIKKRGWGYVVLVEGTLR